MGGHANATALKGVIECVLSGPWRLVNMSLSDKGTEIVHVGESS